MKKLLGIFASPVQPELDDYYEPWTYDYQTLVEAPLGDDFPVARPKSLITGEDTKITWSANWDDNLGGASEMGHLDPIVEKVRRESEDKIKFEFEQTFMFYLPRICEHCLNPSCMASCPSGAIYKRAEDGIVLVDQDRCRGWRQCITGCPYKKIYFNHKTGKAEKCTFCYPRIEVGPADGLLRDLRRAGCATSACSSTTPTGSPRRRRRRTTGDLYEAQLDLHARPERPRRDRRGPGATGIPEDWMDAARRSPVYALAKTLPGGAAAAPGVPHHADGLVRPAAVADRRPAARAGPRRRGPRRPVRRHRGAAHPGRVPRRALHRRATPTSSPACCSKLAAMRAYMRDVTLGRDARPEPIPAAVGMTEESLYEMYRLMAIAKYDERYVIPKAHVEQAHELEEIGCSLDFDEGPGMYESGPFGEASGRPAPVAVETFNALQAAADLRRGDAPAERAARPGQPAQLGRQRRPGRALPDDSRRRPRRR